MTRFPERLVTARLVLRPPAKDDAAGVLAAVSDSWTELHRWMPWAKERYGMEQARSFCADARARFDAGRDFTTLLTLADSGEIVGSAGLMGADADVPSFEIGYWARTPHTGRGYVTEAAAALARLAFGACRARRVELRIDRDNARSQAVAERLGFELEATLRAHRRNNDGRLTATRIYALFDLASLRDGSPARED